MAGADPIDITMRVPGRLRAWLTAIGIGLSCAFGCIVLRWALDLIVPGGAPFALIFPAAMMATLFGRWIAGAVCGGITILFAWYFVYPVKNSFAFASPAGMFSIIAIVIACVITVGVAELFARAVRRAQAERDREIAERDLYLREFEHRVKNNFTVVASLLDLQRRRSSDPATIAALGEALGRIDSIARAHRHLYRGGARDHVDMADYLGELCDALADSLLLRGTVTLECRATPAAMPRDRAVPIGLIVNELVTNAAKHAFKGREAGLILVSFGPSEAGWTLVVSDNGVGMPDVLPEPTPGGGLGRRLIDAFTRQAGGTMTVDSDKLGTRVKVELEA